MIGINPHRVLPRSAGPGDDINRVLQLGNHSSTEPIKFGGATCTYRLHFTDNSALNLQVSALDIAAEHL